MIQQDDNRLKSEVIKEKPREKTASGISREGEISDKCSCLSQWGFKLGKTINYNWKNFLLELCPKSTLENISRYHSFGK